MNDQLCVAAVPGMRGQTCYLPESDWAHDPDEHARCEPRGPKEFGQVGLNCVLHRYVAPADRQEPPLIITGTGIDGIRLSIKGQDTTLTYLEAVQFALDLIATTQLGSVRGERLA